MKIPAKGFTHGGKFHADDVFATALLMIVRPDIKVTRGFVVPDGFDGIVYDVGCGMFDHHQEPRESRPNGVPYAAFGVKAANGIGQGVLFAGVIVQVQGLNKIFIQQAGLVGTHQLGTQHAPQQAKGRIGHAGLCGRISK